MLYMANVHRGSEVYVERVKDFAFRPPENVGKYFHLS